MQNTRCWIVGNWKMHGTIASAQALAGAVAAVSHANEVEVVVCPPAILLPVVHTALQNSSTQLGAQDCHEEASGAFTGNISASMLKEAGCSYVIVGHSERRQYQYETSQQVQQKATQALENGLVPIICVGETLEERESGKAAEVVAQQVKTSLPPLRGEVRRGGIALGANPAPHDSAAGKALASPAPPQGGSDKWGHFLLAYEPVWAIGSGQIPSLQDIGSMHAHIQKVAGPVPVLYGGSVKVANAGEILATDGVAGVLVGGASLKAEEFGGIIKAAADTTEG